MATYTAEQLRGAGTLSEALGAGNTYTFTLTNPLSGSVYFTLEAVRNENGFYNASTSPNVEGEISNLNGVQSVVSSPYIFSVIINPGGGSFEYTPTNNITDAEAFLRATGNTTLQISV